MRRAPAVGKLRVQRRGAVFVSALLTNNSILIPGENTPQASMGRSNHVPPNKNNSALISIGERKGVAFTCGLWLFKLFFGREAW